MLHIKIQFSLLFFLFITIHVCAQDIGKIETKKILAPSLQNNKGGEDANRRLTLYLPSGYEESTQQYPVLYFLHGFANDDKDMMEGYLQFLRSIMLISVSIPYQLKTIINN
jgi:predicted peptidase